MLNITFFFNKAKRVHICSYSIMGFMTSIGCCITFPLFLLFVTFLVKWFWLY